VSGLAIFCYGNKVLGLCLLIYWLIRIIYLKNIKILISCVIGFLIFAGYFFCFNIRQNQSQITPAENVRVSLFVQPDNVTVVGNQLRLMGRLSNGTKISAIYFSNSPSEIRRYKRIKVPILFSVKGDVALPVQATNVNEFDRRKYDEQNSILNTIKINQILNIQSAKATNIIQSVINQCHIWRCLAVSQSQRLPKELKLYFQGLILGARTQDFYQQLTGVKQLGLIHLFSISGLHVSIFLLLIERLLTLFRRSKNLIQWLLIVALPLYFIFTGGATGLLRAIIMAEMRLLFLKFGKQILPMDNFSVTLMICTAIQPALIMQMGNQLSFGLAFCLMFVGHEKFWVQTFLMNLISLPFILFHIFEWHVLSLLANLLILPFFSAFIFPLTFMGGILGLKFTFIGQIANLIIGVFNAGLNNVAKLPGLITFGKPALGGLAFVFIATLILIGQKEKSLGLLSTILVVYLGMFGMIHLTIHGEVTYFDIGQGDCFLVREPFNRSISMIDTGGRLAFGNSKFKETTKARSRAETITINYLKSKGISHLNGLYLSHKDADHTGDAPVVLANLNVDNLYVPLGMQKNPAFINKVKNFISLSNIKPLRAGSIPNKSPFEVLHPFHSGIGENGDSMVLTCWLGKKRWLFTGDLDRQGERDIIEQYPSLKVDVLKLGHHGSKTASDPKVLKQISPKLGIISAGRENRYGHPNEETLQTLKKQGIPYFNTQTDGMISYVFEGNHIGKWHTFLRRN